MESNQQHIHSFEHTVVPATCTQRGYTLHRCACGYEHKDQFTPQSQHTFVLVEEIEPGCTEPGACKTKCSQCGLEQVTPIPAVGHKWGEWTIQQYATCTEAGVQMRPCTRCDARDERPIPASGHKIVSEVRNGVEEFYCANCGMPMEKPIAPPVVETPVQPVAAPVQPPKAEPAKPQQKAPAQPQQKPAKAKKGKAKKWIIAILAVVLALALAVSAIYIIKPDFYYDFVEDHPFFDFLDDAKADRDDDDDDDDDDDKKKKDDEDEEEEESTGEGTGNAPATEAPAPTDSATQPTIPDTGIDTGVPVGTELAEPEVVFDPSMYSAVQFAITVRNGTQTTSVEIAYIENGDGTGVYYMVQGANAAVIERTSTGLLGYKKEGNTAFVLDTTVPMDQLDQTLGYMEQIIGIFTDYMTTFNGATYRKAETTVDCPTGSVLSYDVLVDGQVKAQICVDMNCGLLVYMKNLENGALMDMQSFNITNVQIPAYK